MNRTAFVCFGSHGKDDSLVYHEEPRKDSGEEFFVLFSSNKGYATEEMRRLFRTTVSLSRLGSGKQFFLNLLERYREQIPEDKLDSFFEYCMISVMMRRGKDLYLFRTKDSDVLYWDKGSVIDISRGLPSSFSDIPLSDGMKQGELFETGIEERLVLNRGQLWQGAHTIVVVPSKEFFERYREGIIDKVFFPDFGEREMVSEIDIDAGQSFCGLHWRLGTVVRKEKEVRSHGAARKVSVPALIGIITAAVAFAIFFGPMGEKSVQKMPSSQKALLVADDDSVSARALNEGDKADKNELKRSIEKSEPEDNGRDVSGKIPEASNKTTRSPQVVSLKRAWSHRFKRAVTSTPVYSNGGIVFGCRDGYLYSFSAKGSMRWKYFSGAGIGATPVCSEGKVVCANYKGRIFALEEDSGRLIWKYESGSKIVSSPRIHDDMVIVGTMDGRVISLRFKNGRRLWEKRVGSGVWGTVYAGPGYLMVPTTEGSLVKMNYGGDFLWKISLGKGILSSPLCIEDKGLVVFGCKDRYVYGFSIKNGAFRWKVLTAGEVNAPPVYCDSLIFVGSKDRNLYAIEQNGKVRWKTNLNGSILSRPLCAAGKVFVTTYGARLYALGAKSGRKIDSFKASSPIYSSCAAVGSRLFFGSNGGVLYGVDAFGP